MSVLAWMMVGLIVGLVASKVMRKAGEDLAVDVALGVGGALLGGWLFDQLGPRVLSGVNWWGLVMAGSAAVIVLMGYHTITEPGTRRI